MAITTTDGALLRLLQLSSAALPVGGYSFSQGLEYAIDDAWLSDQLAVKNWLSLQLSESLACVDLPLLYRQMSATKQQDMSAMVYWNDYALACRETAELRLTDTAMGRALIRLMEKLELPIVMPTLNEVSFVTAFALAAEHWGIEVRAASHGYCWSWLENQVAAATKLVPLGQTSAQQLLGELMEDIPQAVEHAAAVVDEHIGASLPALAMASASHETQYSRLFRS